MAQSAQNDARIDVRLPGESKRLIEAAATLSGQTVSGFVTSVAVREARKVLAEAQTTHLSNRDRDVFLKALDAIDAQPNAALTRAAARFKRRFG